MRFLMCLTIVLLAMTVVARAEPVAGQGADPSAGQGGAQVGGQDRPTIYSPVGKRDPFKAPTSKSTNRELGSVSPLERFPVERFELKAILRGLGAARAMVADPEGGTHIVRQGDRMGRERAVVSKILNTEVIVTERSFNYLGEETLYEKILSLPAETLPIGNDAPRAAPRQQAPANAPARDVAAPLPMMPQMPAAGGMPN